MNLPAPASSIAGTFLRPPLGFTLHSSRSGIDRSELAEFRGTVSWAHDGANGLGWHATIGPGIIATHIAPKSWGWNARSPASYERIAVEFSQGLLDGPIADSQIDTFCWFVREIVLPAWPEIPLDFVTHSMLPAGIKDGKSDAYPIGPLADAFCERVRARLRDWLL